MPRVDPFASQKSLRAGSTGLAVYSPITENFLFGPLTQGSLKPLVNQKAAPLSAPCALDVADLYLVGTGLGVGQAGLAVIGRVSTQEERTFRKGDSVFGFGVLRRLGLDYVDIQKGAQRKKITAPLAAAGTTPQAALPTPLPPPLRSGASTNSILDRRLVDDALANFPKTSSEARLLPEVQGGKTVGFKVTELKSSGFFAAVGLRVGDVIARLNDFPVDGPDKVMQVLMSLKGQSHLRLDILRNQQPLSLKFEIR